MTETKSTTGMLPMQGQAIVYHSEQTAGTKVRPLQIPSSQAAIFAGIRINIWNRAKVRRFITHSLAGGGSHNLGYHALRWGMILHGNAGEMGKYAVLSVLPDKIARFLYEYHDTSYTSLGLPAMPLDRSDISVHSILRPEQVQI